jgi:hypothetical protein
MRWSVRWIAAGVLGLWAFAGCAQRACYQVEKPASTGQSAAAIPATPTPAKIVLNWASVPPFDRVDRALGHGRPDPRRGRGDPSGGPGSGKPPAAGGIGQAEMGQLATARPGPSREAAGPARSLAVRHQFRRTEDSPGRKRRSCRRGLGGRRSETEAGPRTVGQRVWLQAAAVLLPVGSGSYWGCRWAYRS